MTRDAPGDTGAGEDNSEKGTPAATQVKLPQAGAAARREIGTGEARMTATGLDEGASAPKPAAQRRRLTATGSATPQSSASLVQCTDPLPAEAAAAAAAVPVTGKRKRVADAGETAKTWGGGMGGSGIDNEEKEKEKKKRRITAAEWKTMTKRQRKKYVKLQNR